MSDDQDSNIADIDFSVIRTAIEIGGKTIEQILNGVHYGSPEVRCLLLDECDLIIECKVCRALFRALPNFIAHKRVYCTRSFQETQPPLFETTVTDETVVVQPTCPEDNVPTKNQPSVAPSPEDSLNQLVGQIQAGKAGVSDEYKFYSNVAGMVERRKEMGKVTNLELTAIPSNPNAVMVNVTDRVVDQISDVADTSEKHQDVVPAVVSKASSRLETLLTQKLLPKCRNESVIKSRSEATSKDNCAKSDSSSSDMTDVSKSKESDVATEKQSEQTLVSTDKMESGKNLKSVPKQPPASRVSLREKKPTVKTRVNNDVPETDDTLDLSSLKCLKCHMSYSSRKTLLYHYQMRHSQLRTFFPCPFCSNIFFYFWGLTRHMMKIHKKSKNQIDKMREKLRKRSFTKSITKSCNIAKDQLQFVADDDEDSLMMEMSVDDAAAKSSKQMSSPTQSGTPKPGTSKLETSKLESCKLETCKPGTSKPDNCKLETCKAGSSKGRTSVGGGAVKEGKHTYLNEYEMPKFHKQPRISLKEGLRNSKDKNVDTRKAVVKRISESPRARNPSWANVENSKSGKSRKSDSPVSKSVSDEEPSPKSKEIALNELQKKLTEAAAVPIATRSSSNERPDSRSSSSDWKNDSTAVIRGSETKIPESPESRRKQTPTVSSSPILEKRRIVSGSVQVAESLSSETSQEVEKRNITSDSYQVAETSLVSETSQEKDKKILSSDDSQIAESSLSSEGYFTAKEESIVGLSHSETKLSVNRPDARRRQIQIGTTFVPTIVTREIRVSVKQKDRAKTSAQAESSKSADSGDVNEKSVEKQNQDTELNDIIVISDTDESRGRSIRRRAVTNKTPTSTDECYNKNNESTAQNIEMDTQANRIDCKDKQEKKKSENVVEMEIGERNDSPENTDKKNDKQGKKSLSNKSKCVNDVFELSTNTEIMKLQTRSASKEKGLKKMDTSDDETGHSEARDRPKTGLAEKGHLHSNHSLNSSNSVGGSDNLPEAELSGKEGTSRSSSVERPPTSKEISSDSKVSPKEVKVSERRDAGESTMRLFASPPGSKPLIKHSRIKKTNEFVVRCVPPVPSEAKTEDRLSMSAEKSENHEVTEKKTVDDSSKDAITHVINSGLDKEKYAQSETSINGEDTDKTSPDKGLEDKQSGKSKDSSLHCVCNRTFICLAGLRSHQRSCKEYSNLCETSKENETIEISDSETSLDASRDRSNSCSVSSRADGESSSKKKEFICHCGREFVAKVGLSNHQRACTTDSDSNAGKELIKEFVNGSQGDGKDRESKSIFSVSSSFELFSCEKCNRVFGRKVSFLNHQQNCTEKKNDKGDNSDKPSNKGGNSNSIEKNLPIKTSSTRRKFVARKLVESHNDTVDSDCELSDKKSFVNKNVIEDERQAVGETSNSHSVSRRKRSSTMRSDIETESGPPEKQFRVIEEIWFDKVPGKPVERVKSNRTYVMSTEGSGKLHCQDTKKLCDIADEVEIKCLVCLQEFTSVSNLRRHAIRHLGWKRYKCKMCRFSSYNKSECNTHIIRTHSEKLRSAAATDYMIVDLNKEACKVRTQKKKQTLRERKATEMSKSAVNKEKNSKQDSNEKQSERIPEDRKKPAIREENIHDRNLPSTFNISTRNSPRKFDTRPYRKIDHMSTLCTRKSYYLKTDLPGELNKERRSSSHSNTADSETSQEKMDVSPEKQKKNLNEKIEKDNENFTNDDKIVSDKVRELDDFESMSDTESSTRSSEKLSRKHRSSSEHKDVGYSSDSCLASSTSPSRTHSKSKSVSSDSTVHKHRKLSGGSSSSEKSLHGAGPRPVTMMSIQDMFELIKPKPKPERKSVGETSSKSAIKTPNQNEAIVRRVSLEGAVVTRKQSVSVVSQGSSDKVKSDMKESSTKGDNDDMSRTSIKTGSTVVRDLNKDLVNVD